MIPKSLSASALACFEGCPSRYEAEYFLRAPSIAGEAAGLGSACHGALEDFVVGNYHEAGNNLDDLLGFYEKHYTDIFGGDRTERYVEGIEMLTRWHERQDWVDRIVLTAEVKESFAIKTSAGEIPFNYIWDRCDLLEGPWQAEGGEVIEITDYKSWMRPISAADLANKVQARFYGLAAQIKFPQATKIWVTFDQLRYDAVGVVFTREQNIATWKYLKRKAEEIIACPDPAPETLNPECSFCIRKVSCDAVASNAAVGGLHSIVDATQAANRRYLLESQKRAIDRAIADLDTIIFDEFEREELTEDLDAGDVIVGLTATRKRNIDASRAATIVGPEMVARHGKLTISVVDGWLKGDELSDQQKDALRGMIEVSVSDPRVVVKPKNPIDEE